LEKRVKVLTAKEQEIGTRFMVEKCIRQLVEEEIIGTKWHAYWLGECLSFLASLGIPLAKLRLRQHVKTELSHYSSETWDIEFDFDSIGWKELQGIANRSDFDLSQHAKFSGKDLSLLQEESGIGGAGGASGESTESAREKVTPFVIEPSIGVERLSLAVLLSAFGEVEKNGEKTAVLKVLPALSPVTVAVFPLMKKDGLSEKAKEVLAEVSRKFTCDYDEAGSIGKRYARHDEIGTPYCVTIDYDSLQDDSVTLRFRDSGRQERVNKGKLADRIQELLLQGVTS
jgi:glycyl-tRNA synthetase